MALYKIVGYTKQDTEFLVLDTSDLSMDAVDDAFLTDFVSKVGDDASWLRDRNSGLWSAPEQGAFGDAIRVSDEFICIQFMNTEDNHLYLHLLSCTTGALIPVGIVSVQGTDGKDLPVTSIFVDEVLTTESILVPTKPELRFLLLRIVSSKEDTLSVYGGSVRPNFNSPSVGAEVYKVPDEDIYKGYFAVMVNTGAFKSKVVNPEADGFCKRPTISDNKLMYNGRRVADLTQYY